MTRYRWYVSLTIIPALITIQGCYTYRSLTKDDQFEVYPNNDDAIRVTLKDGSVIKSPAFMHVVTREPSDLVIGTGQIRAASRGFKGLIESREIDSARTIMTADGEALVCWLKNKTSIAFKPREYLRLTIQDPLGLWCIGEKTTSGGASDFRGFVPRDELADIEIEQLDAFKSAAVVAAPVLLVVVLYEIGYQIFAAADRNIPTGPR